MKNKYIVILMLVVFLFNGLSVVYAFLPSNPYDENKVNENIAEKTKNIWTTITFIVQILAVGCVVFAGLRYMFASASQKADLKQGLKYLAIGAILVFCTITIVQFVVDFANELY